MNHLTSTTLEADRSDPLRRTRLHQATVRAPERGEVLLEVERFALTANNVTYALMGDQTPTQYWDVFPVDEPGWGRVPAWGSVRVVSGDADVARPGQRFVGLVPMADRFTMAVRRVAGDVLEATSAGRAPMNPTYRQMRRIDDDPTWSPGPPGAELLLLPTVSIAALLTDQLVRAGTSAAVVTSASSKTSLVLGRRLTAAGVHTTGLTSAARCEASRSTGAFEQVLSYDEVERLPPIASTLLDVAGDEALTGRIRRHLGRRLERHVVIGATHHDAGSAGDPGPSGPGAAPDYFDTAETASAYVLDHGQRALDVLEAEARDALTPWSASWLHIHVVRGMRDGEQAWRNISAPPSSPLVGTLVAPSADAASQGVPSNG